MSAPAYDQAFWQQLWEKTLREHPDRVAHRPPNAHMVATVSGLPPGRALDAGCGHGAESHWLAAQGWQVTAVDFSPAALAQGRAMAEAADPALAARIQWEQGDLATWPVPPSRYDLVLCLYVHSAGPVEELVRRMAEGVASGGLLLMAGHRPIDPPTSTAAQNQVTLEAARAALAPTHWDLLVMEEHPRTITGAGLDAVIVARRR